jgi:spore germination cell wall hydrolase CwlJ-like protein
VVWQSRQFSWTHDGRSDAVVPGATWELAWRIAKEAQQHPLPNFDATHYHADYVRPYWAASLSPVATIGRHKFYK